MINADMREYNYFILGEYDNYGQLKPSTAPEGQIKMAIYTTSQTVQDNINYSDANYIGLTLSEITDKYEIEYENLRLKVLYVIPKGRYKQVFLAKK